MRCNNISLNNSQGHPGKEGPNGEKGHMVSFLSLSRSLHFSPVFGASHFECISAPLRLCPTSDTFA